MFRCDAMYDARAALDLAYLAKTVAARVWAGFLLLVAAFQASAVPVEISQHTAPTKVAALANSISDCRDDRPPSNAL